MDGWSVVPVDRLKEAGGCWTARLRLTLFRRLRPALDPGASWESQAHQESEYSYDLGAASHGVMLISVAVSSRGLSDEQRQLGSLAAAFEHRFGRRPTVAASAPGRVNLIGEHTDYNQGLVLPIAIDRQTVIVADQARQKQSTFWSIDLEESVQVDLTMPLAPMPGHAANYLLGVAQQFIERQDHVPNLDVAVSSTVPMGAGLSSSAALEVAFATVLEEVTQARLAPLAKALFCQQAEHEFPGTPCGIMDMYTAVFGQAGHALLLDCQSDTSELVPLPGRDELSILIIDTQVRHELSRGQYARRRGSCEAAARALGVPSLRDATADMVNQSGLTAELRMRALHVVTEIARTRDAADALRSRDFERFGDLMFASHDSLRDLFEVSCPELDVVVDAARSLRDTVLGARLTGGGFGGCVVALAPSAALNQVVEHLHEVLVSTFGRPCPMFTVEPADGARSWPPEAFRGA